jgi:hypothetical protein
MKTIILILAAAAIFTASASLAAPGDDERSYLPPGASHHRAKEPAAKRTRQRRHKIQTEARHRGTPHRARSSGRFSQYAQRDDFGPEDLVFFVPRVLFGILEGR